MRFLTASLLAWLPGHALAHGSAVPGALHWDFQPWVVALLIVAGIAYAVGLARLWRESRPGAGITPAQACAFWAGWLVLALALCSPLDDLSTVLFSAHMVQHELLMVAAAPLLVLGRPLATWAWALPRTTRADAGRWTRLPPVRSAWRLITHPFGAFVIHAIGLWVWHVPRLFDAALGNEAMHALQHASFLFSALLFWWAVWGRTNMRSNDGAAVLYLFATMLHTGALGALLTLSPVPWYAADPTLIGAWGLSAVEDQQIGGLIMWIPAGTVYIGAALLVMARWLAAGPSPTSAGNAS